jgi:hypothetical protein
VLNRVSDLLHLVDRESRVLDAAEARALRNEIEGHLDAAIMARLEMGATPEEAEREAVAAFGDVRRIVRAMRPSEAYTWFDRRFFISVGLGWLALVAAGFLGAIFFAEFSGLVNFVVIGLSLSLTALVVWESVRARKVQFLPILVLFPLFSVLGAIGQAASFLPYNAQTGEFAVSRRFLESQAQELHHKISATEEAIARHKRFREAFDRGEMVAPEMFESTLPGMIYGEPANRREGDHRWKQAEEWLASRQSEIYSHRSDLVPVEKRLATPWISSISGWLVESAAMTSIPATLTLLLNLFVAFIAWLARRLPRRGQTA